MRVRSLALAADTAVADYPEWRHVYKMAGHQERDRADTTSGLIRPLHPNQIPRGDGYGSSTILKRESSRSSIVRRNRHRRLLHDSSMFGPKLEEAMKTPDYCEDCDVRLTSYGRHDVTVMHMGSVASRSRHPVAHVAGQLFKAGYQASKSLNINTKQCPRCGRVYEGIFGK